MPTLFNLGMLAIMINHRLRIILNCSQEKMIWINTATVIAFMKHPQSFRYFTIDQFPGDPMRNHLLIVDPPLSIAQSISPTHPFPTRAEFGMCFGNWTVFVDLRPEAFNIFGRIFPNGYPRPFRIARTPCFSFLISHDLCLYSSQ